MVARGFLKSLAIKKLLIHRSYIAQKLTIDASLSVSSLSSMTLEVLRAELFSNSLEEKLVSNLETWKEVSNLEEKDPPAAGVVFQSLLSSSSPPLQSNSGVSHLC